MSTNTTSQASARVISLDDHKASAKAEQTQQADQKKQNFAAALLAFESHVRSIRDVKELHAHMCNATRPYLQFRQSFLLRRRFNSDRFTMVAASSLPVVDRDAPFVRWIEKMAIRLSKVNMADQHSFVLPEFCDEEDEEKSTYPFPDFLWTPLMDGERVIGGFLVTRETPWIDNDKELAARTIDLYAHAWRAIKGQDQLIRKKIITRGRVLICAAAIALLGIVPISITAMAPVEVSPLKPFVVAAPFDGVVKEILVDQGATIEQGSSVIAFDDVHLQNESDIAAQREAVAAARFQRASQSAIADHNAKRELAVAKAEWELAQAERSYAEELLAKSRLVASTAGVAIYSDKRDWVGRPVSAGEAILQIADPQHVQFSIDLPVKDSLVLKEGARVKVFLDSDPLNPIEAKLTEAGYQARNDKRDILSYVITASLTDENAELPRIGVQGTAQVYSEKAPLAYVIFRRPLAFMRQFIGW